MSKLVSRVESVRDDLQSLAEHCEFTPREFIRCDELAKVVRSLFRDVDSALLDEPISAERGQAFVLPRIAPEDMRNGLSDLYDDQIAHKPSSEWWMECPDIEVPINREHAQSAPPTPEQVEKFCGWLPLPEEHAQGITVQFKWYEQLIPLTEYEHRARLSMRHARLYTAEEKPE